MPASETTVPDSLDSAKLRAFRAASVALAPLLRRVDGAVYGSWSIRLQTGAVRRLPADLDVEIGLVAGSDAQDCVALLEGTGTLTVRRAQLVSFSSRSADAPVVFRVLTSVDLGQGSFADLLLGVKMLQTPSTMRALVPVSDAEREELLPVLPLEWCIAQKIARLSLKRSMGRSHTRWRDAIDLYDLIAGEAAVSGTPQLASAIVDEWSRRGDGRTPSLCSPPEEWLDHWDEACFLDGVVRPTPRQAIDAINDGVAAILASSLPGS